MTKNEIEAIKTSEAAAINRLNEAQAERDCLILKAREDAQALVVEKKQDAEKIVGMMRNEACEAARADAEKIRENAKKQVLELQELESRRMQEAVRFTVEMITGERNVSTAGDEESTHRGA
jgi:vacuolar-type H+-ATPase subunit H